MISALFQKLEGEWELERDLGDDRMMKGTAVFSRMPDHQDHYHYHEEGMINHSNDQVTSAYQDFLYRLNGDAIHIDFLSPPRKGMPYVTLSSFEQDDGSIKASAVHHCGADIYTHYFKWCNDHKFETRTLISGPHKNYDIFTRYLRPEIES